jgi:5-methylthioribose kinase
MKALVEAFRSRHPHLFFLDPGDRGALEAYLKERGLLRGGSRVLSATKAGEGNMNCTLRAVTTEGSMIIKQSRPWVEKYPQFAAPWDRTIHEAAFYRAISPFHELSRMMPRLLDADPEGRVLVLEDLGDNSDYTGLYAGEKLEAPEIIRMAAYLSRLHTLIRRGADTGDLANRDMRQLNHAHLFEVPLRPSNGLDLDSITPGLAEAARSLQADEAYVREVTRLGEAVYLADGDSLLHGDFFPGSLLRTATGPYVIDPEFGFFGRPEMDMGVFLAHLVLSNQPAHLQRLWRAAYEAPEGFDDALMWQLAGVEIMRRLIGYAQLPIQGYEPKKGWLERSRRLVLSPDVTSWGD